MQPKLLVLSSAIASMFMSYGVAVAAEASTDSIAEIVVTAQKTAQPASKTPLALSVISGEMLRQSGSMSAKALTEMAPNVQVAVENGSRLQVAIRGVTSLDMTEKGDPSTSFNVDGAYIGRPEAQSGSFLDLERIEVLRGPQGTLYGRNATAGAINLITNKPTNKLEGRADLDIGNYGSKRFEGMLNAPVNDSLALRAAASFSSRDTYLNPGSNTVGLEDQDDYAVRLHALITFSPDSSLLLTAEKSHIGGNGSSPVPIRNFFTGTVVSRGNGIANPVYVDKGTSEQLTEGHSFLNSNEHRNNDNTFFRSEFKKNLGSVDLVYQFSHLDGTIDQSDNGTYFGFPQWGVVKGESTQITHEVRLNSVGTTAFKWVAGLYHFNEDISRDTTYYTQITNGPLIVLPFLPKIHNQSKAAFGQASYSFTEDLRLTLGLRTTSDEKTGSDPLGGSRTGPGYSAKTSSSKFNYRVGADYDLSKAIMLYTSLATGYKAGGFNADTAGLLYKPESLTSFEVGAKGRFFDNALRLNVGGFAYDYKDLQVSSIVCAGSGPSSACGSKTTNAASASVQGIEAEGSYAFTNAARLTFGFAATNAEYENYSPTALDNWSGQSLDRAPSTIVTLGYTHVFSLANSGDITVRAGTRYSSAYYISDNAAGIRYQQPSVHKSDVSVTYTSPNGNYYVQAYVKNLEDKVTIENLVPSSFFVSAPRTFGVRAGFNF